MERKRLSKFGLTMFVIGFFTDFFMGLIYGQKGPTTLVLIGLVVGFLLILSGVVAGLAATIMSTEEK